MAIHEYEPGGTLNVTVPAAAQAGSVAIKLVMLLLMLFI
jgi:hypothetical protein